MSEEKELLLDNETEKEQVKNDFELDESWLDELDDLEENLTDSKKISENLHVDFSQNKTNASKNNNQSNAQNMEQIENSVNDFLNQIHNNQILTEKNEEPEIQNEQDNNHDVDEYLDDTPIIIVDYDQDVDNKKDNEESLTGENSISTETANNSINKNDNKKLSLDELIKKYEEKYQSHKKNQTVSNSNNSSLNDDLETPSANFNKIKNNETYSEEEKDNKLAENYVNNLSSQERKEMENFAPQRPQAPKVIVPSSEPSEDDEFSHFKEIERNLKTADSTAKNNVTEKNNSCAKKISAFTKIAGFTRKYLFFLIALGVVIIGSSLYIFLTFFNK